jgi:hypothetical protein
MGIDFHDSFSAWSKQSLSVSRNKKRHWLQACFLSLFCKPLRWLRDMLVSQLRKSRKFQEVKTRT